MKIWKQQVPTEKVFLLIEAHLTQNFRAADGLQSFSNQSKLRITMKASAPKS
jgi:hypothetical protein